MQSPERCLHQFKVLRDAYGENIPLHELEKIPLSKEKALEMHGENPGDVTEYLIYRFCRGKVFIMRRPKMTFEKDRLIVQSYSGLVPFALIREPHMREMLQVEHIFLPLAEAIREKPIELQKEETGLD